MSVATQCPSCNRRFAAPDHLLGKGVKCPQCGNQFLVQAASPALAAVGARSGPASSAIRSSVAMPAERRSGAPPRRGFPVKLAMMAGAALLGLGLLYAAYAVLFGGAIGGWAEYASSAGGFSVLMPGTPSPQSKTDAKLGTVQEISQSASSSTYSVHYFDLPAKPYNNYLQFTYLRHLLLTEKSGAKLARQHEKKSGDHAGWEITVDMPNDQTMVRRYYLANARVFWVTAQFPKASVPPDDARKFLDSFKITKAPPAPANSNLVAAATPPPAVTPTPTPPPATTPTPAPKTEKAPTPAPQPQPKVEPKVEPKVQPKVEPKVEPKGNAAGKDGIVMSEDERTLVELINQYRVKEKQNALKPTQRLCTAARAEAKGGGGADNYGYTSIFRLTISGQTPQQVMDNMIAFKPFRTQLVDEDLEDIGVGINVRNDGNNQYIVIMGGRPQ